jgi:predicted transcriptional regulator
MSTITLSPQLINELEQVAEEQAVKPEEILENAVRVYLRQLEHKKIKSEAEAFRIMHVELAKQYLGQFVAIHNGQLVDHDEDFQALHSRIRQRFGRQPILLRRVTIEPERVLIMRSPRLERD